MIWYIVFIERIFRDCSRKIVVDDKVVPIIIRNEHGRRKFLGDYNIKGIIGRCILKTDFIKNKNLRFKHFEKYEDNLYNKYYEQIR